LEYQSFGVNNFIGSILADKVSVSELKKMDLHDLYVQYVVLLVKKQNEISATNEAKVKR
jgi:hypothetical protein